VVDGVALFVVFVGVDLRSCLLSMSIPRLYCLACFESHMSSNYLVASLSKRAVEKTAPHVIMKQTEAATSDNIQYHTVAVARKQQQQSSENQDRAKGARDNEVGRRAVLVEI
jgi:hypothetical protein